MWRAESIIRNYSEEKDLRKYKRYFKSSSWTGKWLLVSFTSWIHKNKFFFFGFCGRSECRQQLFLRHFLKSIAESFRRYHIKPVRDYFILYEFSAIRGGRANILTENLHSSFHFSLFLFLFFLFRNHNLTRP